LHLDGILKAAQEWNKCISVLRNSAGKQWHFFAGNELYLTLWCLLVFFLSKGSCLLNTIRIEFCGANPPSNANCRTASQMNHLLRNPKIYYHATILPRCKIHINIILASTRRSSKRFPSVSLSDQICVRTCVRSTVSPA
jgi:hypothetical protein